MAEVAGTDLEIDNPAAGKGGGGLDQYKRGLGEWPFFLSPPLLAELLIPFAILRLSIAAYLWFLISAACMFSGAWMSGQISLAPENGGEDASVKRDPQFARLRALQAAVAACAAVVVLRFVLDTFNLGQVNTLVAGLAVAHIYFYARDKKALSAIALVLAVSIKLTPALLLVYHIAKMRLKFAATCVAILVGVTAVSFLPFEARGLDAFRIFANRTLKNEQGYDLADA